MRRLPALFGFLICFLIVLPKGYAVVGDENIGSEKMDEIRREHEKIMEEENEKKEEEKRANMIRTLEEKRQKAAGGTEEEKALSEELSKLRSEVLLRKKRFRDRIRITPSERVVFDSNVRNQKNAKSDIIFNSGAGLELDLGTPRTRINVDYLGAHADYLHNSKLSRFEHQLGTDINYPISSKTEVEGTYKLSATGNQTSEIRSIANRLRQDAGIIFKERLSKKTGLRLSQTYSDTFFYRRANRDNSRRQFVFSPEFDYFVSPKTSFFTRYALGFASGGAGGSNRAIANEFRGGVRGKIAPKTTALLDLGYSNQQQRTLGGHTNAFVAEVVVISNLTRKSRVEFLINRSLSQATETKGSNFFVTENYRLTGSTQFRRYLSGEIFSGLRRNVFDQHGKTAGSNQRDLTLELGATLRYDFRKWLGFELKYIFTGVNATDSNREYAKHIASFAVNGRY